MDSALSGVEPHKIGALYFAAYVLLWWGCLEDVVWLVASSVMTVLFLRFALALGADQRDTIPPLALILAWAHWGVAYLSLFSKAR